MSIGLLSATGTYLYVFHKPHRNIAKEKPAYIINAREFYQEFSIDEDSGYEKYGNKVVQVSGNVVDVSLNNSNASLVLLDEMEGINCSFDSLAVVKSSEMLSKLKRGDEVILKGQCDGFDMIMGIVLTRCVIIK